jgi:HlyD family secretion protein
VTTGGLQERRAVEIGDFNDEFIEIKSGLKEGEQVALRAPESLEENSETPSEGKPEEGGGKPVEANKEKAVPAAAQAAPQIKG